MVWWKWFLHANLLLLGLALALPTYAKDSEKKKSSIVKLIVTDRRAPVYKEPNFDAEIIFYLKKKKKVYGTRKLYEGTDGLGLFHKVRLRKGIYGYVLDTDVVIIGEPVKNKKRGILSSAEKAKLKAKKKALLKARRKALKKKSVRIKRLKLKGKRNKEKKPGPRGFKSLSRHQKGGGQWLPFFLVLMQV